MIWDPVAICLLEMVLSLRERLIFLDQTGKSKQVIRRRLEEGMKAAGPKFVLSGGCGWNHDALHRFPLVREVIDEVADEIAKGKNFYE